VEVRAVLDLAGLQPEDVRVEVAVGRIGSDGQLQGTRVALLAPSATKDGLHVFTHRLVPELMGRLGYAFRVSPNHTEDPLRRPCQGRMKWS
jgi:starch phosphorylase